MHQARQALEPSSPRRANGSPKWAAAASHSSKVPINRVSRKQPTPRPSGVTTNGSLFSVQTSSNSNCLTSMFSPSRGACSVGNTTA